MVNKVDKDKLTVIASLDDEPKLTGQELREAFDKDSQILADYINTEVVEAINENETNINRVDRECKDSKNKLQDQIDIINGGLLANGLLMVKTFEQTGITVKERDLYTGTFDVSVSGYTCLGAVAFDIYGTKSSNLFFHRLTDTGRYEIGNCEADVSKVSVKVRYLYVKS